MSPEYNNVFLTDVERDLLERVRRGEGGVYEANSLASIILYRTWRVRELSRQLCELSVEARRLREELAALRAQSQGEGG